MCTHDNINICTNEAQHINNTHPQSCGHKNESEISLEKASLLTKLSCLTIFSLLVTRPRVVLERDKAQVRARGNRRLNSFIKCIVVSRTRLLLCCGRSLFLGRFRGCRLDGQRWRKTRYLTGSTQLGLERGYLREQDKQGMRYLQHTSLLLPASR